ncbi:hypothetical protein TNCV_1641281 [Trichonephila clavipes]|nr:hypothetical protein TNCV_1641281 [Trichonephila clavipes]
MKFITDDPSEWNDSLLLILLRRVLWNTSRVNRLEFAYVGRISVPQEIHHLIPPKTTMRWHPLESNLCLNFAQYPCSSGLGNFLGYLPGLEGQNLSPINLQPYQEERNGQRAAKGLNAWPHFTVIVGRKRESTCRKKGNRSQKTPAPAP